MRSYILHDLDSDQDEPKSFGNHAFGTGFGVSASYGRAFNAIPDRVGSAPATEIGVVSYISKSIKLTLLLEIRSILTGFASKQKDIRVWWWWIVALGF